LLKDLFELHKRTDLLKLNLSDGIKEISDGTNDRHGSINDSIEVEEPSWCFFMGEGEPTAQRQIQR
jgi:hypothetical protein